MIRIVEFHNGSYGIEKISFIEKILGIKGRFKDLKTDKYWWYSSSRFFYDCQEKDLEIVKNIYKNLKNPVKRVVI